MIKFITLLFVALLSVSVVAETVYKKTKPDGSVEFTDQASQDSEEVKVRKPTSFSPPKLPRLSLPSKKLSPSFNYELIIVKPVNDSTLLNEMEIPVSITLQPALKTGYGHKIYYQLAGQSITSDKTSVVFKNVDRGTHTISVSIVNNDGEIVSPIASSVIHVKRFFKKPASPKIKPKIP